MTKSEEKKISYPEPDKVFTEKRSLKKYLKYLLFFGPGAIVASLTIGQGQLILGPQIGAWAGYSLLWLITINVGSFIIAFIGCRFTMLSGIGIMDLFARKTHRGWLNWILILIMLVFIPVFTATIMTTLGQAISWISGIGPYIIWGVLFALIAGAVALLGRYKLLEVSHAFFIIVLALGAIFAVISLRPDFSEILPNFFTIGFNVPKEFPSWVVNNYPSVTKTSIPLYMLGYLGTLTVTLITVIGYLGWIKVKKWGVFKDRKDPDGFSDKCFKMFKKEGKISYLPNDLSEIGKSRLLLKPIIIDLTLAFVIISIVSASYMIAGGTLLSQNHTLPEDNNLIQEQLVIFSYLATWLKPVFQVSVIFALFGTIYAGFEAATRMLYETGKSLSKKIQNIKYKRFMFYLLIYILVTSIPLALKMYVDPEFSVLFFLSLTLMFIGVIGVIIYGIGVIYFSQTVLPKEYKLGTIGLILAIIGVILLCVPVFHLLF